MNNSIIKFIANPDKYIFCIGISIIGFLLIFSYMILNQLIILLPLMLLWIGFSIFITKRNYIEYTIQEEKFIIRYMKKMYEIGFSEIEYIVQSSDYTNSLKGKRYKLKLKNRVDVHEKLLEIENKSFTKWILKNTDSFQIKKEMRMGG